MDVADLMKSKATRVRDISVSSCLKSEDPRKNATWIGPEAGLRVEVQGQSQDLENYQSSRDMRERKRKKMYYVCMCVHMWHSCLLVHV